MKDSMEDYVSVFSDWNTWFSFAKNDFKYAARCIQDEIKDQVNPPETAKKRLLYALMEGDSPDFEYALALCNKYLHANPHDESYVRVMVQLLSKTGKIDEAIELANIYANTGMNLIINDLASLYAMRGDIDSVLSILNNNEYRNDIIETFFKNVNGDSSLAESFALSLSLSLSLSLRERKKIISIQF